MADAPGPRPQRDVIPLHPDRPARRRPQLPPELAALLRESARGLLGFFMPAVLLALGAFLLALLAASVAAACGLPAVRPLTLAATAGRWTLLASAGGALALRGSRLARIRWGAGNGRPPHPPASEAP